MMEVKSSADLDDRKAGINANLSPGAGVKKKVVIASLVTLCVLGACG